MIEPTDRHPYEDLAQVEDASALLPRYANISLAQAVGDLARARQSPIWADLSTNLANGAIDRTTLEWAWA